MSHQTFLFTIYRYFGKQTSNFVNLFKICTSWKHLLRFSQLYLGIKKRFNVLLCNTVQWIILTQRIICQKGPSIKDIYFMDTVPNKLLVDLNSFCLVFHWIFQLMYDIRYVHKHQYLFQESRQTYLISYISLQVQSKQNLFKLPRSLVIWSQRLWKDSAKTTNLLPLKPAMLGKILNNGPRWLWYRQLLCQQLSSNLDRQISKRKLFVLFMRIVNVCKQQGSRNLSLDSLWSGI